TGEGIAGLKRFVAPINERIAVQFVAATLGDDIDDAAGGPAVLRVVIAHHHLEFLHCFLRNGGANSVDRVVHGVGAVHADHVGAGAGAADVETAIGGGADGGRNVARGARVGKREILVVAAVDGQVVDLTLVYGVGYFGLGGFDQCGFRNNGGRCG